MIAGQLQISIIAASQRTRLRASFENVPFGNIGNSMGKSWNMMKHDHDYFCCGIKIWGDIENREFYGKII